VTTAVPAPSTGAVRPPSNANARTSSFPTHVEFVRDVVEGRLGWDCDDCGEREMERLCVSCPLACNARSVHDRTQWCLESMLNNNVCNAQCNNAECGHDFNDCTLDQALQACRPAMAADAALLTSQPLDGSGGRRLSRFASATADSVSRSHAGSVSGTSGSGGSGGRSAAKVVAWTPPPSSPHPSSSKFFRWRRSP